MTLDLSAPALQRARSNGLLPVHLYTSSLLLCCEQPGEAAVCLSHQLPWGLLLDDRAVVDDGDGFVEDPDIGAAGMMVPAIGSTRSTVDTVNEPTAAEPAGSAATSAL